jgi:hypothetical protein
MLYMASHADIQSQRERLKLICMSPLYALLQYTKILGASKRVHDKIYGRLDVKDELQLTALENCFKVQLFSEFFLQNLP